MAVTIKELSRFCGLSVSTVSKALNGYSDISEATRQKVVAAAAKLGYYPNAHARALKSGRSFNLGVLFVDDHNKGLTHAFFSGVLECFKSEAERRGYDVTFISHNMGEGRVTYLEHCHYREVDGVCIAAVDFSDREVQQLIASELPIVTIDHSFNNRVCIQSDNVGGMEMLVEYIFSRGHRRIACIHGLKSASTDSRIASFCRTAARLGFEIPDEYLVESPYNDPKALRDVFKKLLALPVPPTCIMCCDDWAAFGAYRAAAELGIDIPNDISIAGFDGIQVMQLIRPKLTTVRQDVESIGRLAAERLIEQVESPRTVIPGISTVPCSLLPGMTVKDLTAG